MINDPSISHFGISGSNGQFSIFKNPIGIKRQNLAVLEIPKYLYCEVTYDEQ
jgi:hypothetical protein